MRIPHFSGIAQFRATYQITAKLLNCFKPNLQKLQLAISSGHGDRLQAAPPRDLLLPVHHGQDPRPPPAPHLGRGAHPEVREEVDAEGAGEEGQPEEAEGEQATVEEEDRGGRVRVRQRGGEEEQIEVREM